MIWSCWLNFQWIQRRSVGEESVISDFTFTLCEPEQILFTPQHFIAWVTNMDHDGESIHFHHSDYPTNYDDQIVKLTLTIQHCHDCHEFSDFMYPSIHSLNNKFMTFFFDLLSVSYFQNTAMKSIPFFKNHIHIYFLDKSLRHKRHTSTYIYLCLHLSTSTKQRITP